MSRLSHLRLSIASLALMHMIGLNQSPLHAEEYRQDFETATDNFFVPVDGKASDGSSGGISSERTHSGAKAAGVAYNFTGRGYIQLHLSRPPVVVTTGNRLYCSFWCYGTEKNEFAAPGLRLIDAGGEVFQYRFDESGVRALNGTGWSEVTSTFDLDKPQTSWGAKREGVPRYPVKFLGFGLGNNAERASSGKLFFDDIVLSTEPLKSAATGSVNLSLEPQATGNGPQLYLYQPGSTVLVKVQATGLPPGTDTLRWTATDFDGVAIKTGEAKLNQRGEGQLEITDVPSGIIYLSATALNTRGEAMVEGKTRFAALRSGPIVPASESDQTPFLFGISAHLQKSGTNMEREVALMSALGFRACRTSDSWNSVQPERDVWKWENNDRIFETTQRYGITVTPVLAYSSKWGTTGDPNGEWKKWFFSPPVTQDFANYASEMAKRYGKYTRYWEVWNEPDNSFWLGTAQQYATTFDAAYDAIHRVQPEAQVMNGGFSEVKRRPTFIPDWQKEAKRKPDIFAYHTHMGYGNMLRASSDVKAYLKGANWNMPVWLNESGYSSTRNLTERDQAIALVKKMSSTPYLGFTGYFWYDLVNDGKDPNENEHNFGLVRADYTPKAAAVAARTLMGTLAGRRFVQRLTIPNYPNVYALLFERPDKGGGTLVLWNEEAASVPLFWRAPGTVSRINMMGAGSEVPQRDKLITATAGPEPVFLQFDGAIQGFKPTGSMLTFEPTVTGVPGSTVQVPLKIRNPFSRPLTGEVKLAVDGGWSATQSLKFEVPAGAEREISASVQPPVGQNASGNLKLSVLSPDLPAVITGQIRLETASIVPRRQASIPNSFAQLGEPIASLDRTNIVSLFEVAPLDNLLFKGSNDLSAKAYIARVREGLLVSVRVQDDVFAQNEAQGDEWKGDSLQLALALPSGENYEWVAALTGKGANVSLSLAPPGTPTGPTAVPVSIRREGVETLYEVLLPAELPASKTLPDRFRFSFLVNDNDGGGRKGWIEWTPGIGQSKDPSRFRSIVVQ